MRKLLQPPPFNEKEGISLFIGSPLSCVCFKNINYPQNMFLFFSKMLKGTECYVYVLTIIHPSLAFQSSSRRH